MLYVWEARQGMDNLNELKLHLLQRNHPENVITKQNAEKQGNLIKFVKTCNPDHRFQKSIFYNSANNTLSRSLQKCI